MSRFHTTAAVLLGTGLASASMISEAPSNGPQNLAPARQIQQPIDQKFIDISALVSNRAPIARAPTAGLADGLQSKSAGGGNSFIGTCPCAGSPPEGEAGCGLPIDTFNGGCNSSPPVYSVLPFPGSVCGTAAFDGSTRDTDWYRFTLTATTSVRWTVNGEFDVQALILDNFCPAGLLAVATGGPCTDVVATATNLAPGTYVAWAGSQFTGTFSCGTSDDYRGTLSIFTCTTPANDLCASATAISGNGPWFGTNLCAADDGPPPTCGGLSPDVWYNWTANVTGSVTFNTCNPGTTYDTVLEVYAGSACLGALLGCNDDVTCTPIFRSGLTVPVTLGSIYKVRVGGYFGTTGDFELNVVPPCSIPTNDNCAAATAIAGNGPFFGSNICGTDDGPAAACGGLSPDVWYNWTSNTTGTVIINTCNPGTTYDTVLEAYDTAACYGTLLGCNDDVTCPQIFRSGLPITVVNGNVYKIRVGGYFGTEGSFEMTIDLPPPPPDYSVCQYDDGVSERAWNLSGQPGEEMIWLNRYGNVGDITLVSAIAATFGSPADPWGASPNGTAARLHIWDDPNDDGNPLDAILLQSVNTTVQFSDTDTFQSTALAPAVTVNGAYFVGVSIIDATGIEVNMSEDYSVSYPSLAWAFGNPGGLADVVTLSNNSFNIDMNNLIPGVWMIRSTCGPAIAGFCYPGVGTIPCPCANPPSGPGRSCNNFGSFTGGAALAGSGNASITADTLLLSASGENNTALTVFWGGTVDVSPGFPSGAGIRCVAVNLKRLYKGNAVGGAIARPGMGDPTVHIAQGGIAAGNTRYYYNTYRDPNAAGPCGNSSSTINTTNAVAVTWTP